MEDLEYYPFSMEEKLGKNKRRPVWIIFYVKGEF